MTQPYIAHHGIRIRPRPLPRPRPGHADSDHSRRRLRATLRAHREVKDHRQTGMFPIRHRNPLHCNARRCRTQAPPHGRYSVQSSHTTADDAATFFHGRRHPGFSCLFPHALSEASLRADRHWETTYPPTAYIPGTGMFAGRRFAAGRPHTGASTGTGQGISVN